MNVKELLRNHGLKETECRSEVLSIFHRSEAAVSLKDVETSLHKPYDRVTTYRTLKSFLQKGIIHKVLDDTGTIKYALCTDSCDEEEHDHEHVHFKCIKCGETQCMEQIKIPKFKLPRGYVFVKSDLLIQGVCRKCNT